MFPLTAHLVKSLRLAFALALLALLSVPAAHAGIVYATGFETSDSYSLGAIAGQNGWLGFNTPIANVAAQTLPTPPFAGAQDVFVTDAGTGQSGPYRIDSPGGPLIDLQAELYIASSTQESIWQFAATGDVGLLTPFIGGINLYPIAPATDAIQLIGVGLSVGPGLGFVDRKSTRLNS